MKSTSVGIKLEKQKIDALYKDPIIVIFALELIGIILGLLWGIARHRQRVVFGMLPYVNMASAAVFVSYFCVVYFRYNLNCKLASLGIIGVSLLIQVYLIPVWVLLGLINGSDYLQLAGDLTYLILQCAYFVLGANAFSWYAKYNTKSTLTMLGVLALGHWLVSIGASVVGAGHSVPISLVAGLLTAAVAIGSFWWAVIMGGALVAAFVAINRAYFFGLLLSFPIICVAVKRRWLSVFTAILALGLAGFFGLQFNIKQSSSGRDLVGRLVELRNFIQGEGDSRNYRPIYQRIFEMERAWEDVRGSYLAVLCGRGFGASIDMVDAPDGAVRNAAILGDSKVHNIHFLWSAYQYRYGLFGVLAFSLFVLGGVGLNFGLLVRRHRVDPLTAFMCVYVIIEFGGSLFAANIFFTNWILFFAAGWLWAERNAYRNVSALMRG